MTNHERLHRLFVVLVAIGLVGAFLSRPQPVCASLSQPDREDLTEGLQILSAGWIQEHVDRANSILSKPEYTSTDWQEFFLEFFSAKPFTDDLRAYLAAPVFWRFDDNVHPMAPRVYLPLLRK